MTDGPETAPTPEPSLDPGEPACDGLDAKSGPSEDIWALRVAMDRMLGAAETARVPWTYSLGHLTDPANALYREHLAAVYVARKVGLPEPPSNGYDIERMEHDLAALADFGCFPLHDFAERHRAASLVGRGG